MARIHGRRGRVYIEVAQGEAATPLPFVAQWSISFATDKSDVTAQGDDNKVYVAGLPDASGDWSGWYDDSTEQSYSAAVDGVARKFYLYPSTSDTTKYTYGTILPDFTIESDVNGATSMRASWNAAGPVHKSPNS